LKYKILKVMPDAKESEEHIVDCYLLLKNNNQHIEVFIPDWIHYFPYYPKSSKWGIGKKLINNLTGKQVEAELKLIDLEKFKKINEKKKKFSQPEKAKDRTEVTGQIIKKEEQDNSEKVFIDCGTLTITAMTQKGKFSKGDYITGKGLLYAYLISIEGEELK